MNRKINTIICVSLAILLGTVIVYVLPEIKGTLIAFLTSWEGEPVSSVTLLRFDRYFFTMSAGLSVLTVILAVLSMFISSRLLKPVDAFINQIKPMFSPVNPSDCKDVPSTLHAASRHANIINSVPMGIMVVNDDGTIQMFNQEAGIIADLDPDQVIGSHMITVFPNKFYNKTMEVILTGREHLSLRNILRVGGFFKEIFFSISPLQSGEPFTGAVIVFQDVTPQDKMVEVKTAYALSKDLSTQKDLDSTVQVVADSAAEMAGTEFSAVFLADENGQLLIMSSHGLPQDAIKKYNALPAYVDSPNVKNLFSKMIPLLHGDIKNKPDLHPFVIVPEIQSMYIFPVVYANKLIGLLSLYSQEQNKLSKDTIYLIQSMSGQLNTAIANFYELQRTRTLATLDGMTGLYNKTRFLELLEEQLSETLTSGSALSVAMLDIDHFKRFNDTYGHQFGDQILKEIAGIISINVREEDRACRYGGEEFSIIMQNTDKNQALEVIERIREIIEDTIFKTPEDELPIQVTISGGVVTCPDDAVDLEELILYGDIALYSAKKLGRNKIVGYTINQKMQ